jgi:hypothetical protein
MHCIMNEVRDEGNCGEVTNRGEEACECVRKCRPELRRRTRISGGVRTAVSNARGCPIYATMAEEREQWARLKSSSLTQSPVRPWGRRPRRRDFQHDQPSFDAVSMSEDQHFSSAHGQAPAEPQGSLASLPKRRDHATLTAWRSQTERIRRHSQESSEPATHQRSLDPLVSPRDPMSPRRRS